MAKWTTKTVATRKVSRRKRWMIFENVLTNKKGAVRLYDRARITPTRGARHKVRGIDWYLPWPTSPNPWRRKAR